ncbi:MAG: SAM-dependent methyltransferase [Desulfobacterales bacterium CG07_land_8_20_14_0_80_52_14]|nr:MAG: SAM-dependent methyltransferase [Desulfobacterales bacterium CG07_land_8_20_14_0_80_52_14]
MPDYVHGYSERENVRLFDQATTLTELLHSDTIYPAGSTVLEAGCGVGAQTVILAKNSPGAQFTSINVSPTSLEAATALVERERISNVTLRLADIFNLPFATESFDHIFVCFVLEHLAQPLEALLRLKSALKPGGSITVIEGDHGSTYFYPESQLALQTIQCLVDLQTRARGNALIGRQIYPLLRKAGFRQPLVSPRMVYVDSSRPELVEGFSRNTFIAMVEGVKPQALEMRLMEEKEWDQGISDLYAATTEDGVFCYTFFKGRALR